MYLSLIFFISPETVISIDFEKSPEKGNFKEDA